MALGYMPPTRNGKVNSNKRFFTNVLLLLTSVFFVLFIGEAVVRFRYAAWTFQPEPREIPYLTEKESPRDGRNRLGLRNREIMKKEENILRIMFLGDSLAWGSKTSSGKFYTKSLKRT